MTQNTENNHPELKRLRIAKQDEVKNLNMYNIEGTVRGRLSSYYGIVDNECLYLEDISRPIGIIQEELQGGLVALEKLKARRQGEGNLKAMLI
nr:RNA polymerase sigma factor sigA [Ipomoea batatas]